MPGTGPPIARRDPRRCKYLSGKGGEGGEGGSAIKRENSGKNSRF